MKKKKVVTLQNTLLRNGISRVLVCRPNHRLGNAILLTPLVAELERLFAGAEIDILSEGTSAQAVFIKTLSVKNIFCLPTQGFKHPLKVLGLLGRIRKVEYDLIIDPSVGSGFGRVLIRLLRGRYKLGFYSLNKPLMSSAGLTHRVSDQKAGQHFAKRPINLLINSVSNHAINPDQRATEQIFPVLDLRLDDDERRNGKRALTRLMSEISSEVKGPVIGLFANATGIKRYPTSWWNALTNALSGMLAPCSFVEFIPAHGQSMLDSQWPSHYSPDIRYTAAVMRATDLIISGDCGVMHLAVATGVPTVGLFAKNNLDRYAPYGEHKFAVSTRGKDVDEVAREVATAVLSLPLFSTQRIK